MWTDITRAKHARKGLRYSSDLTDGEGRFWSRWYRQGRAWANRRWVVERTFAWLGRNRRLAKDFGPLSKAQPLGSSWPRSSS